MTIKEENPELFSMFETVLHGLQENIEYLGGAEDRETLRAHTNIIEGTERTGAGDNGRHYIVGFEGLAAEIYNSRLSDMTAEGIAAIHGIIMGSIAQATRIDDETKGLSAVAVDRFGAHGTCVLTGRNQETVKKGLEVLGRNLGNLDLPEDSLEEAKRLFEAHKERERNRERE
jgi:hypothetical protein